MILKISLIFTCFWFACVKCEQCPKFNPCPPVKPLGDMSKPEVEQTMISNTILNLWTRPKPVPSKQADNLQAVLVNMMGSDNCDWHNTSTGASYMYWILAPQMDRNPSLCTHAAIVASIIDDSCESKKKAFQRVPLAFTVAAKLVAISALENSGCGNSSYMVPSETCPDGGKKINVDGLINKINDKYPPEFLTALKDVCQSDKFEDQIMCVTTAAITSPGFRRIMDDFSDELKLSFFNLFLSPVVPQRCCPEFKEQLDRLMSVIDAESQRCVDEEIKKLTR